VLKFHVQCGSKVKRSCKYLDRRLFFFLCVCVCVYSMKVELASTAAINTSLGIALTFMDVLCVFDFLNQILDRYHYSQL